MKIPSRVERIELVSRSEAAPKDPNSFLQVLRLGVINTYVDGTRSRVYSYDGVVRKWMDAVVMALTSRIDGALSICLRACARPPILLRSGMKIPFPDEKPFHMLWELPAGLIEDREIGEQGLRKRASLETLEETGYRVAEHEFEIMRGAPFVSPGVIPERLYFFRAHIRDVCKREAPAGDGSLAEDGGGIWWANLDEAIELCERGEIVDLKTELGLRRLAADARRF